MLGEGVEHRPRLGVFEAGPTHLVIRLALCVFTLGKYAPPHRFLESRGLLQFFDSVQVIETAQKQQISTVRLTNTLLMPAGFSTGTMRPSFRSLARPYL